ncbi:MULTISPECIES: hypothetical protein [Clostridium]|uniref:hypothetical protein n=1 Tax=Clostridium TaxID=1485 RepID=UPI0018987A23|nr:MULTISPECIES: hypothetical protein [Clostridium]MDI9217591.1 hypothetical protein [Clostridium tertium]
MTSNIENVNKNFEESKISNTNTSTTNSIYEFNNVVLDFKNIDEAVKIIEKYSFCESLTISKRNRINIKIKTSNLLLLFNQLSKDNLFYLYIDIVKCDI